MAIIGIDLGTSNSAAAVSVGREAVMIEPAEGSTDEGMVFPSYIAFDRQRQRLLRGYCGETAVSIRRGPGRCAIPNV